MPTLVKLKLCTKASAWLAILFLQRSPMAFPLVACIVVGFIDGAGTSIPVAIVWAILSAFTMIFIYSFWNLWHSLP